MPIRKCETLTDFYWDTAKRFMAEGSRTRSDVLVKIEVPEFERDREFEKLFYNHRLEKIWRDYYEPYIVEEVPPGKVEVTAKSYVYTPETKTKCLLDIIDENGHLKFVFRRWELFPAGYFDLCCIDRLARREEPKSVTLYISAIKLFRKGITPLTFWANWKDWELAKRNQDYYEKELGKEEISFSMVRKRVNKIKELREDWGVI